MLERESPERPERRCAACQESYGDVRIPWRGSTSDLVTDVFDFLSPEELRVFVLELVGRYRADDRLTVVDGWERVKLLAKAEDALDAKLEAADAVDREQERERRDDLADREEV